MIDTGTLRRTGLALAACAQQLGAAAPQATGQGMQGHDISSMSMQEMMAHCTEMRQQMQSGATMDPEVRTMMSRCHRMSCRHPCRRALYRERPGQLPIAGSGTTAAGSGAGGRCR